MAARAGDVRSGFAAWSADLPLQEGQLVVR
jgi:hypothetical protein